MGLVGACFMFVMNVRNVIFLLPVFLIGMFTFVSGIRFGMYLAPFIGIGIGFLIYFVINNIFKIYKIKTLNNQNIVLVTSCILFLVIFYNQNKIKDPYTIPVIASDIAKQMSILNEQLPKNSAIWTWWDYGYAYQYLSKRPVFIDGGSQTTPKTYFVARSFATNDFNEGWQITSFIANNGLIGIHEEIKKGKSPQKLVEDIKNGYYQQNINAPIYWVFTQDLLPKFYWIYRFGHFDFDRKELKNIDNIFTRFCKYKIENNEQHIYCPNTSQDFSIDTNNGIVMYNGQQIPVQKVITSIGKLKEKHIKTFQHELSNVIVLLSYINKEDLLIVITDKKITETLFYKMFLLQEYDSKYFELVYNNYPLMVVYKVKENIN